MNFTEGTWEACQTINNHWGNYPQDILWKDGRTIIRQMVDVCSKGGNLLLNVGPDYRGNIPAGSVRTLQEVGTWMKRYSASLHGAKGTKMGELAWGRVTHKPWKIYLHIFDWPNSKKIRVPGLKNTVTKACLLADPNESPLEFKEHQITLSNSKVFRYVEIHLPPIKLPAEALHPDNTVFVVETSEKELLVDTEIQYLDSDYENIFLAYNATIKTQGPVKLNKMNRWSYLDTGVKTLKLDSYVEKLKNNDTLSWSFRNSELGDYFVIAEYAAETDGKSGSFTIECARQRIKGQLQSTRKTEERFEKFLIGKVSLFEISDFTLTLKVQDFSSVKNMHLKSIILKPARTTPREKSDVGLLDYN